MQQDMLFNLPGLRALTGSDLQLEQELIGLYLEEAQRCLERMQSLLAQGDAHEWKMATHEFAGASATIHADKIAKLCKEAESLAHDDTKWKSYYEQIRQAYGQLVPVLKAARQK